MMKQLFYRMHPDKSLQGVGLENSAAGAFRSSCWLIGGGPSLTLEMVDLIASSPAPRMCINLAGTGLIRPTYWTSYDPTERFLRSIYLDPGIIKFLHARRGMDVVPETTFKVCESPQLYVFNRDIKQDYQTFLTSEATGIVDWQDSMVQGIDILYRLGYRRIFLAGCEMRVKPNAALLELAAEAGVDWDDRDTLRKFIKDCEQHGLTKQRLAEAGAIELYHFDEVKSLEATINTDFHYYRVSQYLRLSRRAMSLAGLELISVTPGSRLNDYFPVLSAEEAARLIRQDVGDPDLERVRGLYSQQTSRGPRLTCEMQDFPPHQRQNSSNTSVKKPAEKRVTREKYDDEAEIHLSKKRVQSSQFGQWCREQYQAE